MERREKLAVLDIICVRLGENKKFGFSCRKLNLLFLEAIASLEATNSLTHSVTHSVTDSGFFQKSPSHGNLMEISWKSHGNLMEISWISHGNLMEISWKSHGNLMVISW